MAGMSFFCIGYRQIEIKENNLEFFASHVVRLVVEQDQIEEMSILMNRLIP
jgi:hypothetical protein